MNKAELQTAFPEIYLLEDADLNTLTHYLHQRTWIDKNDSVLSFETVGDGNMNITLRVNTEKAPSIILKQSVPWVAKYPAIEAPWDRIIREARFYQSVSPVTGLSSMMPTMFGIDVPSRIAAFEDLGQGTDCSLSYDAAPLDHQHIKSIAQWLSLLHNTEFDSANRSALTNRDMRALNHEHIFNYPLLQNNGFDLEAITPGLQKIANELKANTAYVERVKKLGEDYYLSDGTTLLHGDYFPGSWFISSDGLKIIDPEFCFFGHPEFDVSVVLAHFKLSNQPDSAAETFLSHYEQSQSFSLPIATQLAGVEIMRRIIGVAQLPIRNELKLKEELLNLSLRWVLS